MSKGYLQYKHESVTWTYFCRLLMCHFLVTCRQEGYGTAAGPSTGQPDQTQTLIPVLPQQQ